MKKILVTGAGGRPDVNFTRSLRAAPENVHLVGTDSNKYYLHRAMYLLNPMIRHLISELNQIFQLSVQEMMLI